jgi:hypothetical protein
MTAPQESLKIFTEDLHISRMRSVTSNKPIASIGNPMAVNITVIATRLAAGIPATPIDVSKAIKTTVN